MSDRKWNRPDQERSTGVDSACFIAAKKTSAILKHWALWWRSHMVLSKLQPVWVECWNSLSVDGLVRWQIWQLYYFLIPNICCFHFVTCEYWLLFLSFVAANWLNFGSRMLVIQKRHIITGFGRCWCKCFMMIISFGRPNYYLTN